MFERKRKQFIIKFEFVEYIKSVYNSLLSMCSIAGPVSGNQNGFVMDITPKGGWKLNSLKHPPLAVPLAPLVDLILIPEQGQYLGIPV